MKTQDQKDEEIVGMVTEGDKELYGEIIRRYEGKLRRYVLTIVRASHDADDILQEVFLKAYKNLRKFDRSMKFSSWIYRIAHNESINHVKSGFFSRIVSLPDWLPVIQNEEIEDRIDDEIYRKKLESCMDRLELRYREPLVLHVYQEKSYEEISDILRIPVVNVGVLIFRAKTKIKKICRERNAAI